MNRTILFLLAVGLSPMVSAQTKEELNRKFQNTQVQNELRFDSYAQRNNITDPTVLKELKSNLAGFAGNHPIYWKSDDVRANRGANIPILQDGTMPGLNGLMIDGAGQNIIVMDGGRVFEKHRDFGANASGVVTIPRIFDKEFGSTSYSSHATNCAGIIASEGVANANTLGVLNSVKIDSYAFATTPQGNNFVKLNSASGANISNHSYGINLGWSARPTGGFNWVSDYDFSTTDTWSGSYGNQDEAYDDIVYSNPDQIVIKSAGNYFGDGPSGNYSNAYRLNAAGTSYSAPIITGIAGALTQIKRNLSANSTFKFKADEMKALLTHTANEAGANPGPDVAFGWGFADAEAGAQFLIDNNSNLNHLSK